MIGTDWNYWRPWIYRMRSLARSMEERAGVQLCLYYLQPGVGTFLASSHGQPESGWHCKTLGAEDRICYPVTVLSKFAVFHARMLVKIQHMASALSRDKHGQSKVEEESVGDQPTQNEKVLGGRNALQRIG